MPQSVGPSDTPPHDTSANVSTQSDGALAAALNGTATPALSATADLESAPSSAGSTAASYTAASYTAAAYDASAYPFDTVCKIATTIGGVDYVASGVLISPDEVLTASHVVYTEGVGLASAVVVAPGYSQGVGGLGVRTGTYVHYELIQDAGDRITLQQSQYDYAVIHLSSPVTNAGYMGLAAGFAGGGVNVTGYPVSSGEAQANSYEVASPDPRFTLLDFASLGPGSSGGPLWYDSPTGPQIVGLVSSGDPQGNGRGALITQPVLNQILQWVSADDAPAPVPTPVPVDIVGDGLQAIYTEVFGRDIDPAALAIYRTLVANGLSLQAIRSANAHSPEAQDRIEGIYHDVVGRDADPAGLASWMDALANGSSLASMRAACAHSAEAQAKIEGIYQDVLGRAADPAGLASWMDDFAGGTTLAAMRALGAQSPEAQANITGIYQDVLGRDPDAGGRASWTEALATGTSLSVMRTIGAFSAESTARVIIELTNAPDPAVPGRTLPPPLASDVSAAQLQLASGLNSSDILIQYGDLASHPTFITGHDGAVFTSNAASSNVYAFGPGPFGSEVVQGFGPADILEFSKGMFSDLADIKAHETQTTLNGVLGISIAFDPNNSVFVEPTATYLSNANYRFV